MASKSIAGTFIDMNLVDICWCPVNSVHIAGYFVLVDALGASLLPPIFSFH